MDLPPELELIHQPARLRIMGLLYRHRDVRFSAARDLLGMTDGNLASHANRLEAAGFLVARRVLSSSGFEQRYRITPAGIEAFRDYVGALRSYLEGVGLPADETHTKAAESSRAAVDPGSLSDTT